MTANRWPPSAYIVDVLVAINIPNVGSIDSVKNDGLSSHRFERPDWGTDTSWHQLLGSGEDFF
jgi:hypothetical protein